jgi:hypothetical protein
MGAIERAGSSEGQGPRAGLDRRTMIKGAAVAGAAAWTAPMIIDSLTSPAAAASKPGTCYKVQLTANFNSCGSFSAGGVSTGNCTGGSIPTGWGTATGADAAMLAQLSTTGTCNRSQITATLTNMACSFSDGSASNTGGGGTCTDTSINTGGSTSTVKRAALTGANTTGSSTTYYFVICCN